MLNWCAKYGVVAYLRFRDDGIVIIKHDDSKICSFKKDLSEHAGDFILKYEGPAQTGKFLDLGDLFTPNPPFWLLLITKRKLILTTFAKSAKNNKSL